MRTVGVKVLKNRLSEYIRLAAAGETILISDRDRVVAELRPPEATRSRTVGDAMLADLVRSGALTPAPLPPSPPPAPTGRLPLRDVLERLDEDRAER